MNQFGNRGLGYETIFGSETDLMFVAGAHAAKNIGIWAGKELGKDGFGALIYASELLDVYIASPGRDAIIEKIIRDFRQNGVNISRHRVLATYKHEFAEARELAMKELI